MDFILRVLDRVVILLAALAFAYLFGSALLEQERKEHSVHGIVSIVPITDQTTKVVVATRDGGLYAYDLQDSTWQVISTTLPGKGR